MPTRFVWTLLLLTLLGTHPARAITRNVPSQYATIQAAIDDSISGDTVLVSDGTYTGTGNVDLDFLGKAITVTSVNGPASTIIDCQASDSNQHRAASFVNGETASTVLSGFTIGNGDAPADADGNYYGGALYILNSSPTITNCVMSGNSAAVGGAVYIQNGRPTFTQCTFSGDTTADQYGDIYVGDPGGAVDIDASGSAAFIQCAFANNSAISGGAVEASGTNGLSFTNCTFEGDYTTYYDGGALDLASCTNVSITSCTFTSNSSQDAYGCDDGGGSAPGGAIEGSGSITIDQCVFSYNSTDGSGGAIDGSSLTIKNCTFNANGISSCYGGGAGGAVSGSSISLTNSTFVGNIIHNGEYGIGYGGALVLDAASSVVNCTFTQNGAHFGSVLYGSAVLTNCILYNNTAIKNSSIVAHNSSDSAPVLTYCDVQGGHMGTGNINADPLFVNAPSDLHLQDNSPCLGAGTPNGAPSTDKDGNPRPNPPSIGAYEVLDTTPPVTTYTVTTGYITLTATDNGGSGVAVTYFSLDGSAYAVYSGPQHFYGHHTIKFYSVDNAGNTESVHTATVNVPEPVPSIASLSPSSIGAGGPAFTLTLNGTNFTRYSVVKWNGTSLTTSFVSASQITAHVPASLIANVGTATVKVVNPTPGGGASNSLTVTVNNSGPPVTTAALSGTTGNNGYYRGAVTITLSVTDSNGAGYVKATFYKYDGGSYRTYSGPFGLGSNGAHTVTFYSTDKGGESETPHSVTFSVDSTAPTTTHTLTDNPQGIKVTLSATDAGPSGVAATFYSVDGAAYQTYSAPFEVTGFGYHTVAFSSTDNAGNTEAVQNVQANINYPVPSTTSLSPASAQAGGPSFTLTVNGHNFNTGSVVFWNGTALTTTFVAYQQVTAHVSASLIASVATASVTVVNPAPGGGTSNVQTFTITGTPLKVTVGTSSRASGVITMNLVVQNIGSQTVQNVAITSAQLGTVATTTALPLNVGTISAGGSENATLTFPGSAGSSGSTHTLTVDGTYSSGTFHSARSVTLP